MTFAPPLFIKTMSDDKRVTSPHLGLNVAHRVVGIFRSRGVI